MADGGPIRLTRELIELSCELLPSVFCLESEGVTRIL